MIVREGIDAGLDIRNVPLDQGDHVGIDGQRSGTGAADWTGGRALSPSRRLRREPPQNEVMGRHTSQAEPNGSPHRRGAYQIGKADRSFAAIRKSGLPAVIGPPRRRPARSRLRRLHALPSRRGILRTNPNVRGQVASFFPIGSVVMKRPVAARQFRLDYFVGPASAAELPEDVRARLTTGCDLLRQALGAADIPARLLGAAEDVGLSFASVANCAVIPDDPVNVWRDHAMVDRLGPPETEVLYLGGAWLEEEVLIAALSAVRIGYDTRVFTDLSVLRSLLDRTPALDRLAQHGILTTTVRQTVMEWSLSAPNEDLARRLRAMLEQ